MSQRPPPRSAAIGILAAALLATPPAFAGTCSVTSGLQRAVLLELYTSEGCSSCPPADRWLSSLVTQGAMSGQVIPLAMHVDYWDSLGWKDRFANPAFTTRQRTYAVRTFSGVVYTPQVMLNGQDFRGWANPDRFRAAIAATSRLPARADIRLALNTTANTIDIDATAQPLTPIRADFYLAVFENDLTSSVKAGENSGALLHHDAVVRTWIGPLPVDTSTAILWHQHVAIKMDWKVGNLGIAAFMQAADGAILQAVATRLCRE